MSIKSAKTCGQCRKGENYGVPADYAITGYRTEWDSQNKSRKRAFRANVCSDHLYVLDQDGATITTKKKISA